MRRYFAITCIDRDDPEATAARDTHMQAHTDYLMANLARIVWAGARQDGGDMTGSFYIIVAPSAEAAREFVKGDPFHAAGIFESVDIADVRRGIFQPVLALGAEPAGSP